MNTKRIISIAIMLALPFTARGDYTYNRVNTPAKVAVNGTVTEAKNSGPYQIATIENDDDEHIASTAYVKGAYNDTIAAVNRVFRILEMKQYALNNVSTGSEMGNEVDGAFDFMDAFVNYDDGVAEDLEAVLLSGNAVAAGIKSQRVEIYTNWDDDDATTDVALKTVLPDD